MSRLPYEKGALVARLMRTDEKHSSWLTMKNEQESERVGAQRCFLYLLFLEDIHFPKASSNKVRTVN